MGIERDQRARRHCLLGAARGIAIAAMMPAACGGSVSPIGGDSPDASPARNAPPFARAATGAGVEGNAPDDAARPLPSVLECEGEGGSVAIALPCQLGMGPVFEMECQTDPPGLLSALFGLGPPLALGVPLRISAPRVPPASFGFFAAGQITFDRLDLGRRTLLATLSDAEIGSSSGDYACTGVIWAVPGGFL